MAGSLIIFIVFSLRSFGIERRDSHHNKEISYFLYPLAYAVPGVGKGEGIGGTVVNWLGEHSTLSFVRLRGEWEIDSVIATGIPLFTSHFTLSGAYVDARKGGFSFYEKGPDSSSEPEFTLHFEYVRSYGFEFGLNFFDHQLEFYLGLLATDFLIDTKKTYEADIEELNRSPPEEQEKKVAAVVKNQLKYVDLEFPFILRRGLRIDVTDSRVDPRRGIRFQFERYGLEAKNWKHFHIDDYALTGYLPTNDQLNRVLVAHIFYSASAVTKPLNTENSSYNQAECLKRNENPEAIGLEMTPEAICRGVEQGINDFIEIEAKTSSATRLGGTQRLRSYPVGRFHDQYTFSTGLEYRIYFAEQETNFDFIVEKGVFEALQIAFFYELGQVSSKPDETLFQDLKYSVGLGFRIILSSVVLRTDIATGAEGSEVTAFIGYGF